APPRRPWPAWGWAALAWTAGWWVLAWSRFAWFAPLQPFTFLPLWLGFIAAFRALAWRRGAAPPRRLAALFAASAGFWWGFEWLDRFTGNWRYLGIERFGPLGYALNATLCFSTVLPAVAAARDWIGTHPRWNARMRSGPAAPWLRHPAAGALLGAGGLAGLFFAGARPAQAYPALWAAPLALAFAAGILGRRPGIWSDLARGDWRRAGSWAAAGLLCGFFWELWNWRSLARWAYAVPYADRWHVFAMPAPGFAGYLPFGLECLLACALAGAGD
ncbi:MAG TPA: hypothetical protein VHC86_14690, partial [Opitutaceae bacterium]|nr:hypothetical protein [Opitutaceae bacterium]